MVKRSTNIDYNLINASLDFGFNVFDMPLSLYGDYVENDDADDLETGYLAGIKLGKAKKKGSWQVQYQYEDLEADATLGWLPILTSAGGGTDGKGSKFSAKYAIDNKWYVGATYFDNTRGRPGRQRRLQAAAARYRLQVLDVHSRCSAGRGSRASFALTRCRDICIEATLRYNVAAFLWNVKSAASPSSSGPGHCPFTAVTGVRTP